MHNYNFWLFIMVCKEHILETLAFKEWISITGRNVFSMSKWRQGVIEVPKTVYQQAMLELSQLLLMTATTYVTVKIPKSRISVPNSPIPLFDLRCNVLPSLTDLGMSHGIICQIMALSTS